MAENRAPRLGWLMLPLLAILLSSPPDTLRLGPGVHPGPLVLTRPTIVIGAPGAILRGTGRGTVLRIEANGTEVRDLAIERSGRNSDTDDAGVLVAADSVVLERLVIRDVLFGVYLKDASDVLLSHLDVQGPGGFSESGMGDGIHFFHSRRIVARGNRISRVRDGMYFAYSDSVIAMDNVVTGVRFGLHYMFSHYNRFERNRFSDNAAGAVLMNSNGLVVRNNVFAWNRGSRSYGLVLQTTTGAVIDGNLVVGNGIGLFIDNAIHGSVTDNLFAGNWLALQLFPNSENTRLTGNAITGNTFDAAGGAGNDVYQLCVNGRGNFWSKSRRDGYDLDGDGVMDAPYATSSSMAELARDREPLRLFLESPAAQVMDWAERTFPVFAINQITDACPLAVEPAFSTRARSLLDDTSAPAGSRGQVLAGAAMVVIGCAALWRFPRGRRLRMHS